MKVEVNIKRGYLYLADLSPNFETESGKVRPVLVIQSDKLNITFHPSTWILPCTSRLTPENILRTRLPQGLAGNDKDCDVMIDQSRAIANSRLLKELGKIPDSLLKEVEKKLLLSCDLYLKDDTDKSSGASN